MLVKVNVSQLVRIQFILFLGYPLDIDIID